MSDQPAPHPLRSPPRPGSPQITAASLSRTAKSAFTSGPFLLRTLQHYRPFISPFEALIPLVPPGSTLLDVGCGGGLFLILLASQGRIARAIGFDSAAPAIATANLARRAIGPAGENLRFDCLDAAAPWPAAPGFFDVVSIIDVLHHVPPEHQQSVITTAAARLKPGGTLLYKDMCERPRWRAIANRAHDLLLARQWIHYAPIASVERWAAASGLKLTHASTINRLWYGHELRVFLKPA